LWKFDHPFYCSDANWHTAKDHMRWASWAEFRDDTLFVTGDRDMNLLVRWDWHSWRRTELNCLDEPDELLLYFVMQRKGYLVSHRVAITDGDEPEVRRWLAECAAVMMRTWEPLMTAPRDEDMQAATLAVLDEMGWPDDRLASAHVEPDGYQVTPPGAYWEQAERVAAAVFATGRSVGPTRPVPPTGDVA
jgi:hypothetical protein